MKKKELTSADIWAMFAETDRQMKETDRRMKELSERAEMARQRADKAIEQAEKDREQIEKDRQQIEKDRQQAKRDRDDLNERMGGISNSNGEFAEEFFYHALEEKMTFAGIHFDYISDKFSRKKIMPNDKEIKAQFDIVLFNGSSIALIEVKYNAKLRDVREIIEKKIPNFRLLYPEYAKYKLYLGLGSLVLKDRIIQEAKKYGIGLLRQRGDAVEYKTSWVKAY